MRRSELAPTLAWFQSRVAAPQDRPRRRPAPAERFILPSRTLSPEQRMDIYAGAYLARLVEALEEDFPATARLRGPRSFPRLCRAYLERHPSRSRSLNPLGRKLPDFLPPGAGRDLARAEAAMSEVFDAEEAAALRPADFAKLDPRRRAAARLEFVPAFRLLALNYDVNPVIDAVGRQRKVLPTLRRKRSWIAVYRRAYRVWRLDLEEAAHAALLALQRGRRVSESAAAAARAWKGPPELLEARLRRWFGEWASAGFFARLKR